MGDLGTLGEGGTLSIVGRAEDPVISGGLNVYPAELEAALDAVPGVAGVAEAAVIGALHPDRGERVVAVLAPEPGVALTPEGVLAAVSERLAGYKRPKGVEVVDALPRNAMGKMQKAALRERLRAVFGGA